MIPIRRVDTDDDRTPHDCAREGCCRHPYRADPWLPIGPLVESVDRAGGIPARLNCSGLAKAWHRGRAAGRVTFDAADRLAVGLLGLHPACVWSEWFDIVEGAA